MSVQFHRHLSSFVGIPLRKETQLNYSIWKLHLTNTDLHVVIFRYFKVKSILKRASYRLSLRSIETQKISNSTFNLSKNIISLWKNGGTAMERITLENFDSTYVDPIEEERIDKFVCDEMSRQIHRYIKGMSGSKDIMLKFEKQLSTLNIAEKEAAIARYIDLNRKVTSGLDFKIVLTRAMANYCDTFDYLLTLVNDKRKMIYYLNRIKSKYIRYHEVIEVNGKFGINDSDGKVLVSPRYDFLRRCYTYVDDLCLMPIIAQKDGKMGLILPDGKDTVVADFVYDDIALRDEYPYFEAKKDRQTILLETAR